MEMRVRSILTDELVKHNTNGHNVNKAFEETMVDYVTPESICAFRQQIDQMSIKSRTICNIILQSPLEFLDAMGMKRLQERLRDSGWKRRTIQLGLREVREMLRQNA